MIFSVIKRYRARNCRMCLRYNELEVGGIEPPSEEGVKPPSTCVAALLILADNPAERQATGHRPALYFKSYPRDQRQNRVSISVALSERRRHSSRQDELNLVVTRQPWRNHIRQLLCRRIVNGIFDNPGTHAIPRQPRRNQVTPIFRPSRRYVCICQRA